MARSKGKLPSTGLDSERSEWFRGHFDAAQEVVDLCQSSGMNLAGKRIADIGCGDGIIDLGIVIKGKPAELVGYDLNEVDTAQLLAEAKAEEGITELPPELSFVQSQPERIPADDDSFDLVVTWSAFEHVGDPEALLRDISRVMKADGARSYNSGRSTTPSTVRTSGSGSLTASRSSSTATTRSQLESKLTKQPTRAGGR